MGKIYKFIILAKKIVYLLLYPCFGGKDKLSLFVRMNIENYLFFAPRSKRMYKVLPELLGKFEKVRLITEDNVKLVGWYFNVPEAKNIVVYCHGQSESILNCQNVAKHLIERGISVFLLSYRGHYKSASSPSEDGIYKDLKASVQFLEKKAYKCSDIILWGRSIGSAPAVRFAANNDVKALIIESGIDNIKNAALSFTYFYCEQLGLRFLFPLLKSQIECSNYIQKFENDKWIKDANSPIFIAHSKMDERIHCASALALKKSNRKAKLFLSKTGAHNDSTWCLNEITEFIHSLEVF